MKTKANIGNNSSPNVEIISICTCLYACIVIKAERVSNDSVGNDYVFPDEDDDLTAYAGGNAQFTVPSGLLKNISKCINLYHRANIIKCYIIFTVYTILLPIQCIYIGTAYVQIFVTYNFCVCAIICHL